jgi:hypothetical protein
MVSENRTGIPPLRPPEAGPDPRASCDFLGSPCPRRTPLVGFLGGLIDLDTSADFGEFLDVIYDVYDVSDSEDFEQLVEHYDNQCW